MATAAGRVGVETVVLGRGDDPAVAVNIDIARSRPVPGEVHCVSSLHFVATRSERDLAGCRCWCSCGSDGRGGSYRRSWSWACGRELEFADARKPAGATGDRIILVSVPET